MLRPKLKARGAVPYGGNFVLKNPDKGMVGRGSNFAQLVQSVKEYRYAQGIPVGLGFEDEVETETCLHHPSECHDTDPRSPNPQIRFSVDDIVRGTKLAGRHLLAGRKLVDQSEADRRARICLACPFQASVTLPCGSSICAELKGLYQQLIGSRTTPYDGSLRSCSICHCWNSITVHIPLELQQKDLTPQMIEQFKYSQTISNCWKAEGL